MKFPIGIEDYKKIKNLGYYYVDKTQIIEEFDSIENIFFIRPRRFGKSLTLSMLDTFYSVEYKNDFEKYFKGTYIYDNILELIYKPNNYEIIRLNFKQISFFQDFEGYKFQISNSVLDKLVSLENIEQYLNKKKLCFRKCNSINYQYKQAIYFLNRGIGHRNKLCYLRKKIGTGRRYTRRYEKSVFNTQMKS